ncbi:MAG: tetratricopeptide repeat protein [Burkholderiales bacterium]|nr:tetratricopeptide repeat protein [Burkholderiales bacterium]
MKIKHFLAAAALGLLACAAFALPSVDQVQSEVRQGHYVQAESMMKEVVTARPDSARAHYVYAEILAHNGRFDVAAQEAARARQIDPKASFTDPAKFAAFEQLLQREQAHASRSLSLGTPALPALQQRAPASNGTPTWVWVLLIAGGAAVLFAVSNRRRGAAYANGGAMMPAGMAPAPGVGQPGYGPGYAAPAAGSGMLGTGLAVAGGVAAGMLAEKLLSGQGNSNLGLGGGLGAGPVPSQPDYDPAAADLERRDVDFGGGDGWGGGGADFGGGDNGSSGGGDGGGW